MLYNCPAARWSRADLQAMFDEASILHVHTPADTPDTFRQLIVRESCYLLYLLLTRSRSSVLHMHGHWTHRRHGEDRAVKMLSRRGVCSIELETKV